MVIIIVLTVFAHLEQKINLRHITVSVKIITIFIQKGLKKVKILEKYNRVEKSIKIVIHADIEPWHRYMSLQSRKIINNEVK